MVDPAAPPKDRDIYQARKQLVGFKSVKVHRIYDAEDQTLICASHADDFFSNWRERSSRRCARCTSTRLRRAALAAELINFVPQFCPTSPPACPNCRPGWPFPGTSTTTCVGESVLTLRNHGTTSRR